MLLSDFILLQYNSPRGPSTQNIFSTMVILSITLLITLTIYIFKPKLRSWMKPILFTTTTGVLLFLYIYLVVKNKEEEMKEKAVEEYELNK